MFRVQSQLTISAGIGTQFFKSVRETGKETPRFPHLFYP